ncbi:hypothetical protein [Streptomyces sp. NPDC050988]|uniref:hypothetical protein n=1 Tax=Streptomyces sp. NPDC050988 TaxID=3365637 RepID=UPI0037891002
MQATTFMSHVRQHGATSSTRPSSGRRPAVPRAPGPPSLTDKLAADRDNVRFADKRIADLDLTRLAEVCRALAFDQAV